MIPRDYITEWRNQAPWVDDAQVEQDLVICRALTGIFSNKILHDALAFRGGTALFKLHLPAARYSEDIDLVQVKAASAGPIMGALREVLNQGLGQSIFHNPLILLVFQIVDFRSSSPLLGTINKKPAP